VNGRRAGWFETAGMIAGFWLAWKFAGAFGGLLHIPPGTNGLLRWTGGAMALLILSTLLGRLVDSRRENNPGGSSGMSLWLRGFGWRAFARLIWLGVLTFPAAIVIALWKSGLLHEVLP
jgi:hypothetical protein